MSEINNRHNTLPLGYKLLWYEIMSVLGQGAFGITYLAYDTNLQHKVAIKEYMPAEFATRNPANSSIHPFTSKQEEVYNWGLDRFMTEARTLARFNHPNIVKVYTVFEQNNTAYIVMEYEQGRDLSQVFNSGQMTGEAELLAIVTPLLEGLEMMHKAHFIHRDIKPANIYIRENGSPVLIDFGSARQAFGNRTRAFTILVSSGYAPYEQYHQDEEHQGPWTDIYALGALLYLAISGERPPDALVRGSFLLKEEEDPLTPAVVAGAGRYSHHFLSAVDRALMFNESKRPQSADEFRRMLLGQITLPSHDGIGGKPTELVDKTKYYFSAIDLLKKISSRPKNLIVAGTVLGIITVASAGIYIILNTDGFRKPGTRVATRESSSAEIMELGKQAALLHEQQQAIDNLVAQANESFGKEHWRITLEKYKKVLAMDPGNVTAKLGMMRLADQKVARVQRSIVRGDSQAARRYLSEAIAIFPDMTEAEKLEKKIHKLETDARRQAQEEVKQKQAEVKKLQQSLEHAKSRIDKAKGEADRTEARTRAATAYLGAQSLLSQATQLILEGERMNEKHEYDDALNTFNRALGLIDEAIQGYAGARYTAERQIEYEARINRQQAEIKKLETSLEQARARLRKIITRADSIEAQAYAEQIYRNAQQLSKHAEDMSSEAIKYKNSNDYDRTLKAFTEAIALFDQASKRFEDAYVHAKNEIAKISRPKPLTKEDIRNVRTKLSEFIKAYERQDLEKLQQISTMSKMRLSILKQIFREYRALEVSISNFTIIAGEKSAFATVTIIKLETQSGDQVIPSGDWAKTKIALQKKGKEWGKIKW